MSNDARRLAALVDAPEGDAGALAFRRDYASRVRQLFESYAAPLAGMSDAPFADLLRTMAMFPAHSLGNQSLIALQAPGSQALASASRWAGWGRRLVNRASAVHLWAPAGEGVAESPRGYERPTLQRAEAIAFTLGLRAAEGDSLEFDAQAIRDNALWGKSQTWRAVKSVRISDGTDHIAVQLLLKDGRRFDRRARTGIGLVKSLMQAGTTPNDETIAAYLSRQCSTARSPDAEQLSGRARDFFQRFKLVPVFDVSETDGPPLPDLPSLDFDQARSNLVAYLQTHGVDVVLGDHPPGVQSGGESPSISSDGKRVPQERLAVLLDAAAEILTDRRARAQNRDRLPVELEATRFVLRAHFGWDRIPPPLEQGLAPNVEPMAAAEVVKARLVSIHDVAKEIILAARPGYDNALLKLLSGPSDPPTAPAPPPQGSVEVSIAEGRKLQRPRPPALAAAAPAAPDASQAMEAFNPFAASTAVGLDADDFNPFAAA